MKFIDLALGFVTGNKWWFIIGSIVVAFTGGFSLGLYERGLRELAADLASQNQGIKDHEADEDKSIKAGKETEHAKQDAKARINSVPKPVIRTGVFNSDGVWEQSRAIEAGESALKRKY